MLGQIKDANLRVYAVWEPCLPADAESKVPNATTKLADERVTHYWDRAGKLKAAYQKVMKWDQPAWDVYYVYGRNAEWKNDTPPVPDYWMHQLRGLPAERMLNGATLAEEVKKRLAFD
ncbi:MAG: hypothetical protein ACREAM_25625 [Blastocatellia bacterium]